MQDSLAAEVVEFLGTAAFGPTLRVVAPPAATLVWERRLLRQLGGGSLRLRVEPPLRLAADLLGPAAPGPLSGAGLRAAVRIASTRISLPPALLAGEGRDGAEALLAETLRQALWQSETLPEAARGALGDEVYAALEALRREVLAVAGLAALAPEPVLVWRAAEQAAAVTWPAGSVLWPWQPSEPALRALQAALAARGVLRGLPPEPPKVPLPQVTLHLQAAADACAEARRAVRRCLELQRAGAGPEDIVIGCADFPRQRGLVREACLDAGLSVDAGPEPVQGEMVGLLVGGLLDLAQGRRRQGLLALGASGLLPLSGPERDGWLREVRDGLPPGKGSPAALVAQQVAAWPEVAPLGAHRLALEAILRPDAVDRHLRQSGMDRQAEILQAFGDQLGLLEALAGGAGLGRPLALRLLRDALGAAHGEYRPPRGAVRVLPLADLAGVDAPHVLLLGLSEGAFPSLQPARNLLSPALLARAEAAGAPLAESYGERRRRAQRAVEDALGAARQSLYLSYSELGADGQAQGPALLLRRLGEVSPPDVETLAERAGGALSQEEAGEILAEAVGRLRDIGGDVAEAMDLLAAHGAVSGAKAHLEGLHGRPAEGPVPVPFEAVTVTALERRAACPFTSFARDVLAVEPRGPGGFDPLARGLLVHQVLRDLPLPAPPAAERAEVVRSLVQAAADGLGVLSPGTPAGRSLRQELAAEVLRTAELVWEEARRSSFRTAGREVSFGLKGQMPPLALPGTGGETFLVEGRIDRLDRLEGRVRVVDYKVRRRENFSFARVFHGLDLQIGAYALAAARSGEPVAMAYWPVRLGQSWVRDEADDDADGTLRAQRPSGLFLADPDLLPALDDAAPEGDSPFHPLRLRRDKTLAASRWALAPGRWQALLEHVARRLAQLAAEARAGDWAPRPYRLGRDVACSGCPLHPACRHVPQRDAYRTLAPVTQEVLDDVGSDR